MSDDSSKPTGIFNLAQEVMSLYEENEDRISSIMGGGDTVDITDTRPLREVQKMEDKVRVVTETEDEYETVSVRDENGALVIGLNDDELAVEVPDDTDISQTEATYANGVLEVTVPREQ